MKNKFLRMLINIKTFFTDIKVKEEFNKLALEDKKNIIIDQLTFGMSPLDTLKLIDMVNNEVKIKMEIKRKESTEILDAISSYYPEEPNE